MNAIKRKVTPPQQWRIPAVIMIGALVGLTWVLLIESKAVSYLSEDPKTCVNCHVMTPQYATWQKSSHREWATCNDCHVPQDNVFKKYLFKAKDGAYHASMFITRNEPEVIRIKEAGIDVVQSNCVRCHEDQVTDARLSASVENHREKRIERKCWECHQEVPHGSIHSLSSIKYYGKVDEEQHQTVSEWLYNYLNESDTNKTDNDEQN